MFAGIWLVLTSLLLRREQSVKTAMLIFSNQLHLIQRDDLEILVHVLCICWSHGAVLEPTQSSLSRRRRAPGLRDGDQYS